MNASNAWTNSLYRYYVWVVEFIIQMQLYLCNWNTMYKACNSWVDQCNIIRVYTEWLKPWASVYNYGGYIGDWCFYIVSDLTYTDCRLG